MDRIWEILRNSRSLLDEAWHDAEGMLVKCEQMYEMVIRALVDETSDQVLVQVANMDREINDSQRAVRKKVFQHLAVGRGTDLLRGLELTAIVIDVERIGDYTKNIGELSQMLKGRMDLGAYAAAFQQVHDLVSRMFRLTREALANRSPEKGKAAMDLYPRVSRICDRTLREVLGGEGDGEGCYLRSHLGLVLLLRYVKRVAAHLKNVCSAIVNPFHQIGFRDGLA